MKYVKLKNAWVAGILNFILPGLGYIYSKTKRTFYAWGLSVLSVWVAVHDWEEIVGIVTLKQPISDHFVLFIIAYPLVFAWDAYRDVKEA